MRWNGVSIVTGLACLSVCALQYIHICVYAGEKEEEEKRKFEYRSTVWQEEESLEGITAGWRRRRRPGHIFNIERFM